MLRRLLIPDPYCAETSPFGESWPPDLLLFAHLLNLLDDGKATDGDLSGRSPSHVTDMQAAMSHVQRGEATVYAPIKDLFSKRGGMRARD